MASTSPLFSPVLLSYVAALRGVLPRKIGEPFSYAQTGQFDVETLLCLAASNPDGRFFGVLPNELSLSKARTLATERAVTNITFESSAQTLPRQLDFLCCEAEQTEPSAETQQDLFALAETHLRAGGLLAYRYRAYTDAHECLRFLVEEFMPELSDQQAITFLSELKTLGQLYFEKNPDVLASLNEALAAQNPKLFFAPLSAKGPAKSWTFETMAGLLPRQFSAVGDAQVSQNYMEMAAPASTHDLLLNCQEHLLYEPIKDFVLQRLVRNDIWVKRPVEQSLDKPTLFGSFVFGITAPTNSIPEKIRLGDREIDLTSPLFLNLIALMCLLPLGVGDFLSHPSGKAFAPSDVLSAIQILVASGIAQPVRERYKGTASSLTEYPTLATAFNDYLRKADLSTAAVPLASSIVGAPVIVGLREALVLQALSRVGLVNISGSLQPTLKELANRNPGLAAQVTDSTSPSDETVHNLVTNVLETGMTRWYAYGLLAPEAA